MSARRLLWRWNRRVLITERRQYAVIFGLILAATAVSVGALVLVYNLVEPPEGEGFGRGRLVVSAGEDGPVLEQALIEQGHAFGSITSATASIPGTAGGLTLNVHDPENAVTAPLFGLIAGRWPSSGDEVAITDRALATTPGTANADAAVIGQQVELGNGTFTIVGLVENPTDLDQEFAVVTDLDAVGIPTAERQQRFLVDAAPSDVTFPAQVRAISSSERDQLAVRTQATIAVNVVSALAMLEVALLAAAGFAVIAQRRARQYGLLAAAGATPRQIRAAATISGTLLGTAAAIGGAVLGAIIALAVLPRLETAVGHRINAAVPWWSVGPSLLVAIVIAAVAARWPSRAMSRQPVVELLAALRPRPSTTGRSTMIGAVLGGLGVGAIGYGFSTLNATVAIVGVILGPIGLLLLAPFIVQFIGRAAARLPLAARLGARSIARYNRRSAAMVGALGLALAVPAAIAVTTTSLDKHNETKPPNISPTTAIAWVPGLNAEAERSLGVPTFLFDQPTEPPAGVMAMADTIAGAKPVPIQKAVADYALAEPSEFFGIGPQSAYRPAVAITPTTEATCGGSCDVVGFGEVIDGEALIYKEYAAWVATPAMLDALDIDSDLIGADTTAITNLDSAAVYTGFDAERGLDPVFEDGVVVTDAVPAGSTFAPLLLTPQFVETEGLRLATIGWLIVSPEPISSDTQAAAVAAAGADVVSEFHIAPKPSDRTRLVGLTVGVLVGLGITIAATGLLTAESAGDLRLLTSLGATPRTARTLSAVMAMLLTVSGAVLAVTIGYLALIPQLVNQAADFPFVVPWPALVTLLLLLPLLAGGIGWMTGDRHHGNLARPT